jgi:hypothetical protein
MPNEQTTADRQSLLEAGKCYFQKHMPSGCDDIGSIITMYVKWMGESTSEIYSTILPFHGQLSWHGEGTLLAGNRGWGPILTR